MKKIRLFAAALFAVFSVLGLFAVSSPAPAVAQCGSPDSCERAAESCTRNGGTWDGNTGRCNGGQCSRSFLGFPTWYRYLEVTVGADGNCSITGPTNGASDPERADRISVTKAAPRVALAIIDILLRLAGMVAFFFIVYSGFRMVLSQGDPAKEKDARETAINALVGMVIAMFAIGIVSFVGGRLLQ